MHQDRSASKAWVFHGFCPVPVLIFQSSLLPERQQHHDQAMPKEPPFGQSEPAVLPPVACSSLTYSLA